MVFDEETEDGKFQFSHELDDEETVRARARTVFALLMHRVG